MAILEVLIMALIPALLWTDIRVFWVINFAMISRQIFLLFNMNAFESKIMHFIRLMNKSVLFLNHLLFLGYYYLSSDIHS